MKSPIPASAPINTMRLEISALSQNENFARSTVAAFASSVNPTLDEINDIKTAVSEAVTNCVVHAYGAHSCGKRSSGATQSKTKPSGVLSSVGNNMASRMIVIECSLYADSLTVVIKDTGVGITDVSRALEPFYTTGSDEERSGMGFTVMQSFMDTLDVKSSKEGTTVVMQKFFARSRDFTKEGRLASGGN